MPGTLLSNRSQYTKGLVDVSTCEADEVRAIRAVVDQFATTPAALGCVHVVDLPPGHVPVHAVLDATDMDTDVSPEMTISLGVLTAGKTDLATVWLADSAAAQTGVVGEATAVGLYRQAPSVNAPMSVGLKITVVAKTFAAGTVGVSIMYRRADATYK